MAAKTGDTSFESRYVFNKPSEPSWPTLPYVESRHNSRCVIVQRHPHAVLYRMVVYSSLRKGSLLICVCVFSYP